MNTGLNLFAEALVFVHGKSAESEAARHALLKIKSREVGGQGHANADVAFDLADGGGKIHTAAQITGKAASMGEGVVVSVLDGLIKDFTQRLQAI